MPRPLLPQARLVNRDYPKREGELLLSLVTSLHHHYELVWKAGVRYADDIIIHCRTEAQARVMQRVIERRLARCKLQLQPEKTVTYGFWRAQR